MFPNRCACRCSRQDFCCCAAGDGAYRIAKSGLRPQRWPEIRFPPRWARRKGLCNSRQRSRQRCANPSNSKGFSSPSSGAQSPRPPAADFERGGQYSGGKGVEPQITPMSRIQTRPVPTRNPQLETRNSPLPISAQSTSRPARKAMSCGSSSIEPDFNESPPTAPQVAKF